MTTAQAEVVKASNLTIDKSLIYNISMTGRFGSGYQTDEQNNIKLNNDVIWEENWQKFQRMLILKK